MSLGVIATVFAVIAVAELPDKTMIATLVMGSRSRPLWVWLGASGAFLVHVALAVSAGRLLELLPHRVLEGVVSALFLAGAAYLLLVPERGEVAEAERETDGSAPAPEGAPVALKAIGTAFGVILVGEFGDLTQLLTLNLAARFRQPWAVATGAALALIGVAAVGSFGGRALLRYLSVTLIRRIGGVVLLGFATYSIVTLVR